jgi:hypothetical protein
MWNLSQEGLIEGCEGVDSMLDCMCRGVTSQLWVFGTRVVLVACSPVSAV